MIATQLTVNPADFVSACLVYRNPEMVARSLGISAARVKILNGKLLSLGVNMPKLDQPMGEMEGEQLSLRDITRLNVIANAY